MFKHQILKLAIPQSEHLRLAGTIALLWGNDNFDKPKFDFESFVKGVSFHDFGYGQVDKFVIKEMESEERLESLKRLVDQDLDDPISNAVAQYHILRLLGDKPERQELKILCEKKLQDNINMTSILKEDFLWADRITDFCDSVSFDFCLGVPTRGELEVYRKNEDKTKIKLSYKIADENKIYIDPWPLSVKSYKGYIAAYKLESYPDNLIPEILKFELLSESD